MKKKSTLIIAFGMMLLVSHPTIAEQVSSKAPPLSPEKSIETMQIQPGYRLVPVLTEPVIHEPSAATWDVKVTPSPSSTFGPTTQYGPTDTFGPS